MLGISVDFTTKVEEFIAHDGPKMSYTTKQLGEELHLKSSRLLFEQGVSDIEIKMGSWREVPCFFKTAEDGALPYDIFAASFYLLSRYEEYLPHVKDKEGRFPASESIAFQHNFLETPVVDFWIATFGVVLKEKFSMVRLQTSSYDTHMLIDVPQAFVYKKVGFLRTLAGFLKDMSRLRLGRVFSRIQVLLGIRKDPYDVFSWLINVQKQSDRKFSYFIELGEYSQDSKNIKHSKATFRSLVKMINDYSNVGLLVSKAGCNGMKQLQKEKIRLEQMVHENTIAVRLREGNLKLPTTYRKLIDQEIFNDYTMGYPEAVGFRAGTSKAFMFFDLDYEIQTPLLVHPASLQVTELLNTEKSTVDRVRVQRLQATIKKVGGVFRVPFTNAQLSQPIAKEFFKEIALHHD